MSSPASLLSGSPASLSFLRSGSSGTITGPAVSVAVVDADITANSLVVISAKALDATANSAIVQCEAGVGFTIKVGAAPTAPTAFNWVVLKY
jgi:hypothetical protein